MSAIFSGMTIDDTIRSDAEGQKTIQNTQVINFRMLRNWVPVLHKLWIHKFNTSVNCDNLCGCPRKFFLRFLLASFFYHERGFTVTNLRSWTFAWRTTGERVSTYPDDTCRGAPRPRWRTGNPRQLDRSDLEGAIPTDLWWHSSVKEYFTLPDDTEAFGSSSKHFSILRWQQSLFSFMHNPTEKLP